MNLCGIWRKGVASIIESSRAQMCTWNDKQSTWPVTNGYSRADKRLRIAALDKQWLDGTFITMSLPIRCNRFNHATWIFDYCTDVTDVLTRLSFPSLRFRPSVFENYHEDTPRSKQHGRSVFQRCRVTAHLGVNQYLYSSLSIY